MSQALKSKSKEGLKLKGREIEKEKETEKEELKARKELDGKDKKDKEGKDLETKGSNPLFDSILQQVVGLLAIVITDRDGVILFKSYTPSFAAQLASEKEKEKSISTLATTGPSASFEDYQRENGEEEDDSSRINETEDDERDDEKEKWEGGSGISGSSQGLGSSNSNRPPSTSGTLATSSSSGGASSFSSSFTLAIQQVRKLNLGENKYITAFYKNRTIIHANHEPLIITLVAGQVANIGLILSRIVPDIKSKLEPVKKIVAESIATERDIDDDHSHGQSSSSSGVESSGTSSTGLSDQRKLQSTTGNSDSVG